MFYQLNLAAFAIGNAFLLYKQYRTGKDIKTAGILEPKDATDVESILEHTANEGKIQKFRIDFFLVYALAVAADWFQVRCGQYWT